MNNQDSFDATQRVSLDSSGHPSTPPSKPKPPQRPRPTPSARAAKKKRQQRIILISLCAVALILLIAVIGVTISLFNQTTEDDGLILKGVNAAGVNLGGKTPEQAKQALHEYTDGTYTQLNMVVSVLDTSITLSPADTGARLDVDAVVEAAYNYGRSGSRSDRQQAQKQALSSGYTISVLPYLNLDTAYIESVVSDLGKQYSTMLTETDYYLTGEAPDLTQESYDTSVVYQTLVIQIGTAEYGLNTDGLYEQILDAYDINLFEVTAQCTINAPAAVDYDQVMIDAGCIAPTNAEFNVDTYEVTPEVYGYGFTMETLRAAVENAAYGDEVTLDLCFIEPAIKKDFYTKDMFQDTLSSYATVISSDKNWNANMQLVCELLDGTIIEAGGEFSFNSIVGQPTAKRGFQSANVYLGKSYQKIIGGGICQVASTLYYCALAADLEILERNSHSYTTDYIQAGFDAEIYYGSMDMRFRNNTEKPLRIGAEISGGELKIVLIGTDTKTYTVNLTYQIDETYEPETVYNTMIEGNAGGYHDGDVVTEGITGYTISTYIVRTDKEDSTIEEEILIAESYYAKRDKVVVEIYIEPTLPPTTVPPTTLPPETTVPSDPSSPTDPSDPTDPTDSTDPTDPTQPTDPTETTTPETTTPEAAAPETTAPKTTVPETAAATGSNTE